MNTEVIREVEQEELIAGDLQRHWKSFSAVSRKGLWVPWPEVSAMINGQFDRAVADNGPKRIKTRSEAVQ